MRQCGRGIKRSTLCLFPKKKKIAPAGRTGAMSGRSVLGGSVLDPQERETQETLTRPEEIGPEWGGSVLDLYRAGAYWAGAYGTRRDEPRRKR